MGITVLRSLMEMIGMLLKVRLKPMGCMFSPTRKVNSHQSFQTFHAFTKEEAGKTDHTG